MAAPQPLPSLTDCGYEEYPATGWAKYLVQTVGRDVMSFCRNTRVSYMIVDRARETVKEINNCIDDVEVNGARDSFKKYTKAIDPLEKKLLELVLATEIEKELYFADVTNTLHNCILSVASWEVNREELWKALEYFNTCDELKELFNESDTTPRQMAYEEAQVKDDKAFLAELRDSISILVSERPASSLSYIGQAVGSLMTLQDHVIGACWTNWKTVITTKISMLVQAVLETVTRLVYTTLLNPDTLKHLKSIEVWKAAKELIEALTSGDESLSNEKYAQFQQALLGSSTLHMPSYIDLMKAAAKIRRPFQAQAFALTNIFFYLVDEFNGDLAPVIHPENVSDLDVVYNKALKALQDAATAAPNIQSFELAYFEYNWVVKAFMDVNESIGVIFNTPRLNLASKWDQKKYELEMARWKDKERMEKFNDRVTKSPPTVTPSNFKVTVTISIEENGRELVTAPTEEEISTRLHALRWRAAGLLTSPYNIERARNIGEFYLKAGGATREPINLNSTLADITGSYPEVALRLIVV